MDRISVFISYSSKQKLIGGELKSYLENFCGYETFIAHDDILGSAIWEEEIIKSIINADFFIPLISREFKESPFTDQETGIAVCLKKKIIPIKLDEVNPYGFIGKYQALQYKNGVNNLALTIAQIGLFHESQSIYYQKALNSIVHAFCKSISFEVANATIQILCKCNDLSHSQLTQIAKAIKTNSQIKNAYGLNMLKECLRKKHKVSID
ncbi:MAG: toll/interleukin-1 receptor domain-containing protein [Candidatus Levybacteria bacterium]|nr:toll/interleukin-1 receptor domain-containing protein [Candidatus Levybacteria bacterium]